MPRLRATHARATTRPAYDRDRDIPRLIGDRPPALRKDIIPELQRFVGRLQAMLRAERQRGLAGHWTYDLSRHRDLLTAYRFEAAALSALRRSLSSTPPKSGHTREP